MKKEDLEQLDFDTKEVMKYIHKHIGEMTDEELLGLKNLCVFQDKMFRNCYTELSDAERFIKLME